MNKIDQNLCIFCLEEWSNEEKYIKNDNVTFQEMALVGPEDKTLTQIKCGHIFHTMCLSSWIKEYEKKTTTPPCPICRDVLIETPAIIPQTSQQIPLGFNPVLLTSTNLWNLYNFGQSGDEAHANFDIHQEFNDGLAAEIEAASEFQQEVEIESQPEIEALIAQLGEIHGFSGTLNGGLNSNSESSSNFAVEEVD